MGHLGVKRGRLLMPTVSTCKFQHAKQGVNQSARELIGSISRLLKPLGKGARKHSAISREPCTVRPVHQQRVKRAIQSA